MTETLVGLEDISVRRGRRTVLSGIDLTVNRGEILAVLGPNGAGKSTLLGVIGGLNAPIGGSVTRHGRVATSLQASGLARRSAIGNVELALAWWGVPRADRRDRAAAALDSVGAGPLAGRAAPELSGGEQRRVHLARSIALRPDVLLLDEPFAGLDPQTHRALRDDTSSAIRTCAGATVVVVHDRGDAWALADRVVLLAEGRIVATGDLGALTANPPSAQAARLLGYDSHWRTSSGQLLLRPQDVRLDPDGDIVATVAQSIRTEEGYRHKLIAENGVLWAVGAEQHRLADGVRLRIVGGVNFPPDEA